MMGADHIHIFDTPFLLFKGYTLSVDQRIIKRTLDLCLVLPIFLLVSPIMILTAVAIKIEDGGPVFYKQVRCTRHEKEFQIYKFRSMVVDAEEDGMAVLAKEHDERITKVGRFIRRTRIDELPQLFNILIGDMSIVGPRPVRPQFVEKFQEEIPRYMIKHQVRPGLTGWAQVNGLRGDTSIEERIEHDIFYIENWTVGFDIKIFFMTFFTGFINKNAY
jgi:exopolysaccharide biosynthesis polyprenyl glycosylphosphotransferase